MFGLAYEDWKKYVGDYLKQGNSYLKSHIYSYPLSKISLEDREWLLSREFFDSYIASGAFLNDTELKKYNTVDPKNNGDLRNIILISPIIYLVFIVIGGHLAQNDKQSNDCDWIAYAGDYQKGIMSYAKPYKDFSVAVLGLQSEYRYYLKTDIASFYPMLNLGILFNEIQNLFKGEDARGLMFYRQLFEYFGDGRYPVISDNIGLSYIATCLYLRKFDNLLIKNLDRDQLIKNYQLVRYVDDLYIAFNCDDKDYNKVTDHLKRYLQEVASDMDIKLNFQKQKVTKTVNIPDDVYANVYDYEVNDVDISYADRYDKKQIIELIDKLTKLPKYPSHKDVEKIIMEVLDDRKYGFYYTEVLNWYIYINKDVFREKEIITKLYSLLDRSDILEHYPKQFGRMIINTCDDDIIKKYLNTIFTLFRTKPTPKFIEFLAKEYLLAHNFRHEDLKKYICENAPELFNYIDKYCSSTYKIPRLTKYNNDYLNQMETDPSLHYLWFTYRCAKNESKILEEFAYYKNYFDRKISYFLAAMNVNDAISKNHVSYQFSYKKNNIKRVLHEWQEKGLEYSDNQIKTLCNIYNIRNDNPVNHASSKLLCENNQNFLELTEYINFLKSTLKIIEKFVMNKV